MSGADQGGAGAGGKAGSAGSSSGRGGSAWGGKAGTASGEGGDAGDGGAGAAIGAGGAAGSGSSTAGTTGSGKGGGSGEAGSDSGPPVDSPPHIVATSPANGEKGVLEDADIIVTFSEPMNKDTTRQAYSSDDLPQDDVTISWLDDTRLLIQPKDPLVYASVDSLDGDAKHYSFTIAGTATDLAGNALGDDRNYTFTTMRHIRDALPLGGRSYGIEMQHSTDGGTDTAWSPCYEGTDTMEAGDTDENHALAFIAAFRIMKLPDGVLEWKSASVRGTFTTSERNPFSRLGDLMAHNVVGDPSSFVWDTEPTEDFGMAASYPSMAKFSVDVLDAVKREYEHRDERPFSVLFKFEDETDDDDAKAVVGVRCDSLLLDFSLTAP